VTDEIKKHHASSLMKACDILVKLAQGGIQPVCVRSFKKDDTSVFVYAHANGMFELEKDSSGRYTIHGFDLDQHMKIRRAAGVAINSLNLVKDDMDSLNDPEIALQKNSTMLTMKKAFEDSHGAIDVIQTHLIKGRTAQHMPDDEAWWSEQANKKKKIGTSKRFTDRDPDNDPELG
jgi:hypothetical protein